MDVRTEEYWLEHPEEFDALSAMDQLNAMSPHQGDTASGDSPDPAPADVKVDEKPAEPEVKAEVAAPVVQAKDGVNIIPYKELETTREKLAMMEQISREQSALIASLQEAKAQDAGTGDTKAQDDVLAKYEGDYPELMEDLKPYLKAMMDGVVGRMQSLEAKVEQPLKENQEQEIAKAHFGFIAEKHPDFEAVAASPEMEAFINTQPSFVRTEYERVLQAGTAEEVVEVLDAFRKEHPATATTKAPTAEEIIAKAEEKIGKVPEKVPHSHSDIPGSSAAHHDEAEAMLEMSGLSLINRFAGKTPDQIEEILARTL